MPILPLENHLLDVGEEALEKCLTNEPCRVKNISVVTCNLSTESSQVVYGP